MYTCMYNVIKRKKEGWGRQRKKESIVNTFFKGSAENFLFGNLLAVDKLTVSQLLIAVVLHRNDKSVKVLVPIRSEKNSDRLTDSQTTSKVAN